MCFQVSDESGENNVTLHPRVCAEEGEPFSADVLFPFSSVPS